MTVTDSGLDTQALRTSLIQLVDNLSDYAHSALIAQALETLVRIADHDMERLDWKILIGSLQDMDRAFGVFHPYRHTRKIAVFGSARTVSTAPEYQMALDFSKRMAQQGFMVMTGAGGGIMEAANQGAGRDYSFGLNVHLPFEQEANPYVRGDEKLLQFKYFFTRKLFFLRETDAIAVFPGGFGTQDEAFEVLTLTQTGKFGPAPMIFVDRPGGEYWHQWSRYIEEQLLGNGLISPEDPSLYTITDRLEVACQAIVDFYRVYHSSRYVHQNFVMRLKTELSDQQVAELNDTFADLLVSGTIAKTKVLDTEQRDGTENLPRLIFHFNQRDLGRLYQMIMRINQMGATAPESSHPEQK
ncbi:MAG: LOG family protein [Prochlorotrichaceae cyanobacterium]